MKHKKPPVFVIKTNDAKAFADMLASPKARRMIERLIIKRIMAHKKEEVQLRKDEEAVKKSIKYIQRECRRPLKPVKKKGRRKKK